MLIYLTGLFAGGLPDSLTEELAGRMETAPDAQYIATFKNKSR